MSITEMMVLVHNLQDRLVQLQWKNDLVQSQIPEAPVAPVLLAKVLLEYQKTPLLDLMRTARSSVVLLNNDLMYPGDQTKVGLIISLLTSETPDWASPLLEQPSGSLLISMNSSMPLWSYLTI